MLNLRLARFFLILLSLATLALLPMSLTNGFQLTLGIVDLGPLGAAEFGVVGSLVIATARRPGAGG